MFEHLSDPTPPPFDDHARERIISNAHRRQRRTRLAVSGIALTPLVALGGIAVYMRDQAGELEHITVTGLVPAESVPPADSSAPLTTSDIEEVPAISTPLNLLVVGIDRRPPGSEVQGSRADTIAVARIDPIAQRVGVLSIPRDLWVTTDGGAGRINSFTENGRLVDVVSTLLDIDINHYIEVDFEGFQSLVDLAGGVSVPFDTAVRDNATGFTAESGCNNLSGSDALAYVRSRRLERLDPTTGEWTIDPTSDLGRIARQQDLVQRIYSTVFTRSYGTVDKARLLTDVLDDLTTDPGLQLDGLRAIFNATALIGAERFDTYDLTSGLSAETIDGNSVLVADPAVLNDSVARLMGDAEATQPEATSPIADAAIEPGDAAC